MTALGSGGESCASPSVSATTGTTVPPAPTLGKIIVSGGSIKAYFGPVSAASSYNAYRDGWLVQVGATSPYTDSSVPAATSHSYMFGSVNSNGQGGMGPYGLYGIGGATPPVATKMAATAGSSSVALNWNGVSQAGNNSVTYNLYRSTSVGGEGDVPVACWVGSNTGSGPVSYTDTDPSIYAGTTYYYKVAAVRYGGGEGAMSNEASATPLTPLLPAPSLSATPGDSSASLTWTSVAGASSYNVYRYNQSVPSTPADNGNVPLVKIGATNTSYTDGGLTNGAWYYYTVNAVSKDGQGLGSNSVSVVPGSGSPTLAAHVVWTSDYTVTPHVQTGSTSGAVGGNTSVHLSLQVPPNFTSGLANVTIHEDAGGSPDVTTTNATFMPTNYSNNNSGWSAVCSDPDPTKAGSPAMAYCDVPWSTLPSHNGNYTITIAGQATIGYSFTPVAVTSTLHVDVENIVITATTPSDPIVTYVPQSGGPVIAQAPICGNETAAASPAPGGASASIAFDVSISAGYKSQQPVTLTIYDLSQQPIKTMVAQASAGGVVIGGNGSQPTKVTFNWDGSTDSSSTMAPQGLYSFQFRVGNACQTNGTGYAGYSVAQPGYSGAISDGDTDKSTTTTISQVDSVVTDFDCTTDQANVTTSTVLTDSALPSNNAVSVTVKAFDPTFSEVASADAGTPSNATYTATAQYALGDSEDGFVHVVEGMDGDGLCRRNRKPHPLLPKSVRLSHPIVAQSTVGTYDTRKPRFLSGTNCSTTITVTARPGHFIVYADVSVGGVPINAYSAGNDKSNQVTLTTYFDSTQISGQPGAPVCILVSYITDDAIASNPNPSWKKYTLSTTAYNKAYVAGKPDIDSLTGHQLRDLKDPGRIVAPHIKSLASWIQFMEYVTDTTLTDNDTQIETKLTSPTVFYIHTHGATLYTNGIIHPFFEACDPLGYDVTDVNVRNAVLGKFSATPGSRNKYTIAPYNFVFLDACNSAGDADHQPLNPSPSDMPSAFGIPWKPQESTTDRAFVGWVNLRAITGHNNEWVETFFRNMNFYTLQESIRRTNDKLGHMQGASDPDAIISGYKDIDPSITGDLNTRLKGVYGGHALQFARPEFLTDANRIFDN